MKVVKLVDGLQVIAFVLASVVPAFATLPTPVGGVITVPDGETVTVTDAGEASTLAAATGLVLGADATLVYACADALSLSADVSGTGTFRAAGSGKVTLSGDNSELFAPGHFEFDEACAAVLSEYGLGSSGTATATFKHSTVDKCVTFGTTTGVLTNHVALSFAAKDGRIIGSEGANATFVQAADFMAYASGTYKLKFDYNVSFVAGTFTHKGNGRFDASHAGVVRFTDDVDVVFGAQMIVYNSNIYFAPRSLTTSNSFQLQPVGNKNFQIATRNLLSSRVVLQAYSNGLSGKYFDFCGCDQEFGHLTQSWNGQAGVVLYTDADKPVLLRACDAVTGSSSYVWDFKGPISYWHDTPFVNEFKTSVITSSGDLTVSKGEIRFVSGSGWSGSNVKVTGSGVLDCQSIASLNTGRHNLVVENGGTIRIADGVTLKVGAATFGNVTLDPATVYTVTELQELTAGENLTIEGSGLIQTSAKSIPGEWNGWPAVGTATKWTVPDNADAVITADDIAKVEALSEIETGIGAVISFEVAGRSLNLKANVEGGVVVRVTNADMLVISGDNSGIVAPGGFRIEGTTTIVSNRFGLGSVKSAAAQFWPKTPYASNLSTLWFGGDDTIANDVGLSVNYGMYVGHQDPAVSFKQNGNISQPSGGGTATSNRIHFRNHFTLADGTTSGIMGVGTTSGGTLCIEAGATVRSVQGIFGSGSLEVFGTLTGSAAIEHCVKTLRCGREDCLSELTTVEIYDNSAKDFVLDLNGCSQTVKKLRGRSYWNSNQQPFDVKSVEPATLTLDCNDKAAPVGAALRLSGQVSLVKNNVSTQLVGCVTSTTTGTMTINDGAIRLERNAKWLGGTIFINGGALIVDASAGTDAFNLAGEKSQVEMDVTGGKLHLATKDCTPSVRCVKVNGKYVLRGTYTKVNCDWITGDGSLTVLKNPDQGLILLFR